MSNFREKLTEIVNKTLSSLTEAEDDYVSVASITNTFDSNKNINIYDDENDGLSKDENAEKSKLTKKALDKIKQSLKVTDELQSILNRISKINKNTDYNEWKVNEEDNTAILRNKNAYIFKQNDNLCLSHDNKVEIFKSVPELHKWLCDNNYPLPHNIKLHESVITEDLDFPAIPAGEVIPRHVDDSYALRFKNRYEGTSWDKILRNRWSNIGTKLGNILGISNAQGAKGDISYHTKDVVNDDGTVTKQNIGHARVDNSPVIQSEKLLDGTVLYYDARNLENKKLVDMYLRPDFDTSDTPFAYLRTDSGLITTTQGKPLETADEIFAANKRYTKTPFKMGRDEEKERRAQSGTSTVKINDVNGWKDQGFISGPNKAKAFDIAGPRYKEYIGQISDDGKYILDVNGKKAGTVENGKVYDINNPGVEIGYVNNQGKAFTQIQIADEASENQINDVWYLKYNNSDLDQNYLNADWQNSDLLTQNLENAAKFISRNEAIDELKNLYSLKTTAFPFKPIKVDDMEECGVTCGGLGSAVQWFGGSKKKEESLDEENLEEDSRKNAYTKATKDFNKNLIIGAPVYNYNGEIIGKVTDRATARNDVVLGDEDITTIKNEEGNVIGKSTKSYPLVRSLDGDTLGYANQNRVYGENNHFVGTYDANNNAYDTKGNKIGLVSYEPTQIITNDKNFPIGYVEDGEAFSFSDDKIGDVADTDEEYSGVSANENSYVVQDLEGNDIGYSTKRGNIRNFNGKLIGRVNVDQRAKEAEYNFDTLNKIADDRAIHAGQADFTWQALGKKPFNPYNKTGQVKPLYTNAINPGNYTADNLFGGLFDLSSEEINKLIVDKDTFLNRIKAINELHGVNFDPEQPIYPRKASKGTLNQQAWDKLQQDYINNVALKKSATGTTRIPKSDKETWTSDAKTVRNSDEGVQRALTQAKEVFDKANADYDNAQGTPYRDIINYLRSVEKNDTLDNSVKNTIYNMFSKSDIDGVADTVDIMFKQQNESVLTEDDTPADFADGGSADTNLAQAANISTTQTTTTDTDTTTDGLDDYGPEEPAGNTPMQFGDVNIDAGGAPDEEEMPQQPESNEKIIDVLVNEKDNSKIKVKVKNTETGETSIKDLSEIDV